MSAKNTLDNKRRRKEDREANRDRSVTVTPPSDSVAKFTTKCNELAIGRLARLIEQSAREVVKAKRIVDSLHSNSVFRRNAERCLAVYSNRFRIAYDVFGQRQSKYLTPVRSCVPHKKRSN